MVTNKSKHFPAISFPSTDSMASRLVIQDPKKSLEAPDVLPSLCTPTRHLQRWHLRTSRHHSHPHDLSQLLLWVYDWCSWKRRTHRSLILASVLSPHLNIIYIPAFQQSMTVGLVVSTLPEHFLSLLSISTIPIVPSCPDQQTKPLWKSELKVIRCCQEREREVE